ncbi:MAG TPA: hypothetical protein VFW90_03110, partial [Candidatus Saccharimonadales bacterium]|nr:hypothetical protein [Candidatus Saccharimonadales bacterium]
MEPRGGGAPNFEQMPLPPEPEQGEQAKDKTVERAPARPEKTSQPPSAPPQDITLPALPDDTAL